MNGTIMRLSKRPILVILNSALIVFLGGLAVQALQAGRGSAQVRTPAKLVWKSQVTNAYAENYFGIFGIKGALVSRNEILFFYTLYDTFPRQNINDTIIDPPPLITAKACPNAGGTCQSLSVVENKALGTLLVPQETGGVPTTKDYLVGFARVPWVDLPDHTIHVAARRQVVPIGYVEWHTDPMVQKGSKSNFGATTNQFVEFRLGQPHDVTLELGSLGGGLGVGALRLLPGKDGSAPSKVNPLHIGVDLNYVVSVITAAEYAALTAPGVIVPDVPDLNAPPTATAPPH
jgi:hypothetical protein